MDVESETEPTFNERKIRVHNVVLKLNGLHVSQKELTVVQNENFHELADMMNWDSRHEVSPEIMEKATKTRAYCCKLEEVEFQIGKARESLEQSKEKLRLIMEEKVAETQFREKVGRAAHAGSELTAAEQKLEEMEAVAAQLRELLGLDDSVPLGCEINVRVMELSSRMDKTDLELREIERSLMETDLEFENLLRNIPSSGVDRTLVVVGAPTTTALSTTTTNSAQNLGPNGSSSLTGNGITCDSTLAVPYAPGTNNKRMVPLEFGNNNDGSITLPPLGRVFETSDSTGAQQSKTATDSTAGSFSSQPDEQTSTSSSTPALMLIRPASDKKRRTRLNAEEKEQVLKRLDEGCTQQFVAALFKVSQNTISNIKRKREASNAVGIPGHSHGNSSSHGTLPSPSSSNQQHPSTNPLVPQSSERAADELE